MIIKEQHKPWKSYTPKVSERDLTECETVSRVLRVMVLPLLISFHDKKKTSSFCLVAQVSTCLFIEETCPFSMFWHTSPIFLNGCPK
jgi:hypothetical protein